MVAHRSIEAARQSEEGNRPQRILGAIGPARGTALSIGILCLVCSTADTQEERLAAAAELKTCRVRFCTAISDVMRHGASYIDLSRIEAERKILEGFATRIMNLSDDCTCLTRGEAIELAYSARNDVVPAIYGVIALVEERQAEDRAARLARITDKATLVDGMLTDMARIGRMIGLISINASVEAARAGGESGRAFQVIAEEVRSLARQSAELLARMRERMADGEGEGDGGQRRS